MRRLYTLLFILVGIGVGAQDYPQFSQHVNLQGLINPAYNGSRESYSALMVTRNQWEGAVTTHALNAHAPLPLKGLGAGLVIIQDNIGLYSNLQAAAAVSYRLHLTKDIMLAAGLQGGLVRSQVGTPSVLNPADVVLDDFSQTVNRPSAGFGFFIYSESFFGGLSFPEVLPEGLDFEGSYFDEIPLYLYGGALLELNRDLRLKPTAFFKASASEPLMLEVGAHAIYKELGSFGVATRTYPFSALVFALEIKVIDHLYLGYSYDFYFGAEQGMKKGTHEISLRFDISLKDALLKPVGSMRFF